MARSPLSKSAQERLERERIDQRYRTGRTLIRAAAFVICAWFVREGMGDLAGENTSVAIMAVLSVFANLKFAVSIALAGTAVAWAFLERLFRQQKVEKLQGRIRELETSIDSWRSTSALTPKGKTNPRDKG